MRPTVPLFLLDDGDVEAFGSLDDLQRYVEPVDAANGRMSAYDAKGLRIDLAAEGVRTGAVVVGGGVTLVKPTEPPVYEPEALRLALQGFVTRIGASRLGLTEGWLNSAPLDELAKRVADFLGVALDPTTRPDDNM